MDIRFGSTVRCVESVVGEVSGLTMHRVAKRLTGMVVRRSFLMRREIEVSLELVERSHKGVIHLKCLKAELDRMRRFQRQGIPGTPLREYNSALADAFDGLSAEAYSTVLAHDWDHGEAMEHLLDSNTRVRATNGNAGKLLGLCLAPDGLTISDLIIQLGGAWGQVELRVPHTVVAEWGGGAIYLRCDTAGLKRLLPRKTVPSGSFR